MAKKFIELQEAESLLKNIGAPGYAINALCLAPSYEAVHRSVYDQCAWERDLAIEQLRNDYGVGLGEKKSADVVRVKHGRWISDDRDVLFSCSECGTQISTSWDYDHLQWNFCPHCGCKMDGKPEEE